MPLAGKESQSEQQEVETLAGEVASFFPVSPAMLPGAGGLGGGQWEGSKEQTIPAIPRWAGGQTPSSLHLPLPQPVPSGLPAQPSPGQQAGIPACASYGPDRAGSGLQRGVCERFCCFVLFFRSSSLPAEPWSFPALGL